MKNYFWLVYEKPPHSDAVSYPADRDDLTLIVALLKLKHRERNRLSEHLRNWLAKSVKTSAFERPGVAVRFGEGLYQPVPWRLAKWLACILPIGDGGAISTRCRIEQWLNTEQDSPLLAPKR